MSKDKSKNLIVVLGMHRSGTSALTRALECFDISLGDNLVGAGQDNPKGYFEDLEINHFNSRLLQSIGRDWHTLLPLSDVDFDSPLFAEYRNKAVELITAKMAPVNSFGFKDPRMCMLLPFWKLVFDQIDCNVYYLISSRNPTSVASSLNKRDGYSFEKSYFLWLQYMSSVLFHTINEKRIVSDYSMLLINPVAEMQRLSTLFLTGLNLNTNKLSNFANDFIDTSLNHSSYDAEDIKSLASPDYVKTLFNVLSAASEDVTIIDSPSSLQIITSIYTEAVTEIKSYCQSHYDEEIKDSINSLYKEITYLEDKLSIYIKSLNDYTLTHKKEIK
jgi:hypothetical protein